MHGRIKVRTTEEQRLLKQIEQAKKLAAYRAGMQKVLSTRNKDTYDPVSLGVCAQILCTNPDIYTLWNYRKEVVLIEEKKSESEPELKEKLVEFLENEMRLTEQCLLSNPKSYGSWHHRYWILNRHPLANWSKEFALCNKYLTMDDRNFHCWDYRRMIVNKIGISVKDELEFSEERLNVNFSNYSSWHYRSTLQKLTEENVETELTLVQNAVFTDPFDTSAWFYLRWVLSHDGIPQVKKEELLQSLSELQEIEPDCKWILIAKSWIEENLCLNNKNKADSRVELYKKLIEIDPIRKGHYEDCLKKQEQGDQ